MKLWLFYGLFDRSEHPHGCGYRGWILLTLLATSPSRRSFPAVTGLFSPSPFPVKPTGSPALTAGIYLDACHSCGPLRLEHSRSYSQPPHGGGGWIQTNDWREAKLSSLFDLSGAPIGVQDDDLAFLSPPNEARAGYEPTIVCQSLAEHVSTYRSRKLLNVSQKTRASLPVLYHVRRTCQAALLSSSLSIRRIVGVADEPHDRVINAVLV